jgi:UDP-N-acetylglucosamine--dolichyl-phosphate N-acetylglucosaminephosphotransferase
LTIFLIPIVSVYVLRRNMFGYDINKRGSPAGTVKVPESLGLVTGVVYLVVTILFQHSYFTPENTISESFPPENAVCDNFQPSLW